MLCDQVCYLYICDKAQNRIVHYASHPDEEFLDV